MISGRNAYIILTVLVIAAILYCYNPFALFFQNDDFLHVLLSRQGVFFQQNSFRPICDLSVMLDYKIWKLNAVGFHITNFLLHVFCSVLVYVFIKNLLSIFFNEANNKQIAFLSALLFLAYPFHSEAVFWILGRSAIIATLFSLLFLILYIRPASLLQTIASIVFFALALFTYEASWLLIIFAWLLYFVKQQKHIKQGILLPSLLSIAFIIYLSLRFITIHEIVGEYEAGNLLQINIQRLLYNLATLAGRSALPDSSKNLSPILAALAILIFTAISFHRLQNGARKNTVILISLFIFLLLPYISIGISTNGTEGERFLYMPSIIWCAMLAYLIYAWKNIWIRYSVALFVILLYISILYVSSINYKAAGSITRTTVAAINNLSDNSNLYVANIPQEQHGALIFRKGIKEATILFQQRQSDHKVNICSYADSSTKYIMPYPIKFIKNSPINNFCSIQLTKGDVYFLYADSALVIMK